jgi:signal transduction histidine kinase
MSLADDLIRKAERREAVFGVVGLGYVGLPLAYELVTAGFRPAVTVAIFWGIGHACQGYFALLDPDLRKRWTEDELRRRMPEEVSRNRRELEDRHARNLEHLSASIAHEIRNPITAAKSLLQQMGEDPHSHENVEYAHVALQELERVERSISRAARVAASIAIEERSAFRRGGISRGAAPAWVSSI